MQHRRGFIRRQWRNWKRTRRSRRWTTKQQKQQTKNTTVENWTDFSLLWVNCYVGFVLAALNWPAGAAPRAAPAGAPVGVRCANAMQKQDDTALIEDKRKAKATFASESSRQTRLWQQSNEHTSENQQKRQKRADRPWRCSGDPCQVRPVRPLEPRSCRPNNTTQTFVLASARACVCCDCLRDDVFNRFHPRGCHLFALLAANTNTTNKTTKRNQFMRPTTSTKKEKEKIAKLHTGG